MLNFLANSKSRNCEGTSRRDFLRVGSLGLGSMAFGSLTLSDMLRARAEARDAGSNVKDTSVIWLWLGGGPTHVETFDPKMTAPSEYRSVTGEVKTNIPGVTLGGHFQNMAQVADKENYGGKKDWEQLVLNLTGNYSPDSIVFVISDFIDTNPESFLPELAGYFTKVYGIMVRDPTDNELPKGVGRMYLQDAEGKQVYLTDLDRVREEYAVLARRQIDAVRDVFHSYDQLFFEITTEGEFAEGFIKALGAEEVIIS